MRIQIISIILVFLYGSIVFGQMNTLTVDPALAERGVKSLVERQEFSGYADPNIGSKISPVAGLQWQTEYLTDGGDGIAKTRIEDDWTVRNLETEDTVAHFDTLDGRTLVEPSNRVFIYAPRFGAVRKIEGVLNNAQITALSRTDNQYFLNIDRGKEQLGYTVQGVQSGYARTRTQLSGVEGFKKSTGAGITQGLGAYSNFESAMYYSNLLRQQFIGLAELTFLTEGKVYAKAWQGNEGIKVQMNILAPMEATSEEGAESFFQIEEDESKTFKLRLIKTASKKSAQPGEIVEFTLRFDNIGTQLIGNVTILDNLTTRLEFLPGTALSSLKSGFVVQPNDGGSFTLRFEITDPLNPGEFGVIQFQCRVR
ncbi:MAG: DUF11 domain-containing protein [Planctomycetaceae bacterium]|jgi:uncharacterized repeat protein (TIGR01451 family)|nr:DUF11 domain-containing protein [Planctomycetaceae bacterium]